MRISRSIVPNLFTLANLFCGFSAIIAISDSKFYDAGLFILFAGIFDALDGFVARLTRSASPLGVQLDSLCDATSFGVAPSFLLYDVCLQHSHPFGILLASVPALAGVFRLARFNVEITSLEDKKSLEQSRDFLHFCSTSDILQNIVVFIIQCSISIYRISLTKKLYRNLQKYWKPKTV